MCSLHLTHPSAHTLFEMIEIFPKMPGFLIRLIPPWWLLAQYCRCFIYIVCTGFCKVDETPKGWYVQYIDRDPETIRRQEELEKKKKQEMDDEERSAKFIEEQVRRGQEGKEPEVCLCAEKNVFFLFSCSNFYGLCIYRKNQCSQNWSERMRMRK